MSNKEAVESNVVCKVSGFCYLVVGKNPFCNKCKETLDSRIKHVNKEAEKQLEKVKEAYKPYVK